MVGAIVDDELMSYSGRTITTANQGTTMLSSSGSSFWGVPFRNKTTGNYSSVASDAKVHDKPR